MQRLHEDTTCKGYMKCEWLHFLSSSKLLPANRFTSTLVCNSTKNKCLVFLQSKGAPVPSASEAAPVSSASEGTPVSSASEGAPVSAHVRKALLLHVACTM